MGWKKITLPLTTAVVTLFCVRYHHVKGYSMEPTLSPHDRMFSEKFPFLEDRIGLNDLVIFQSPYEEKDFVKRVVGMPGDNYMHEGKMHEIPRGYYFVMGDNREISEDSRQFGPVKVKSRVIFVDSEKAELSGLVLPSVNAYARSTDNKGEFFLVLKHNKN